MRTWRFLGFVLPSMLALQLAVHWISVEIGLEVVSEFLFKVSVPLLFLGVMWLFRDAFSWIGNGLMRKATIALASGIVTALYAGLTLLALMTLHVRIGGSM